MRASIEASYSDNEIWLTLRKTCRLIEKSAVFHFHAPFMVYFGKQKC